MNVAFNIRPPVPGFGLASFGKLAFAFLLLAAIAGAQGYDPNYNNPEDLSKTVNENIEIIKNSSLIAACTAAPGSHDFQTSVLSNSLLALFIMAMVIGLMYMAGNFLQVQSVLVLARQEINEFLITALIVVFFTMIISAPTYFGIDLFDQATTYSYKMLYKVGSVSSVLVSANIVLNSIYTIYIPFGQIRKALTMQLGPALRPIIDGVSFSLQFLITTYGEWTVFVFMFCFIQRWFLPFFFPLGLIMRSFPQTRGGGNALIALSIALSTIYPFMFFVDSVIFAKQFPEDTSIGAYFEQAVRSVFAALGIGGVAAVFFGFSLIFVSPILVGALLLISYLMFDVGWEVLHLVMIFSIILPVLNIFLTLSFTREISKLLGTEISLGAFAKLI